MALETIQLAHQAGFTRISCDLMIGIPEQNLNRVLMDVETLVNNDITHISIYMLDIDKHCVLLTAIATGQLVLPSEDEVADTFEMLQKELPPLGLLPYEISNYASPQQASKHNSRYWQRLPYLGLGPSAASHINNWRWTEDYKINDWLKHNNDLAIQQLDDIETLSEIPLLGFRMCSGINWDQLRIQGQKLNLEHLIDDWESKLVPFMTHGLVAKNGSIIYLTTRGILLSNAVLQIFV
jgi:oxygen-independent coproporphyrinogen-3 oxidase